MIGSMRLIGELYNFEVITSSRVYDTPAKVINNGQFLNASFSDGQKIDGGEEDKSEDEAVVKPSSPRA